MRVIKHDIEIEKNEASLDDREERKKSEVSKSSCTFIELQVKLRHDRYYFCNHQKL